MADEQQTPAFLTDPAQQASFIKNGSAENRLTRDNINAHNDDRSFISVLEHMTQANPYALYSSELATSKPEDNDNIKSITKRLYETVKPADLERAAQFYSPIVLADRLEHLPDNYKNLAPELLDIAAKAHPAELQNRDVNLKYFEAREKFVSEIKAREQRENSSGEKPLQATGLDWQYRPNGSAVLDITDLVNSPEKFKALDARIRSTTTQFAIGSPHGDEAHTYLLLEKRAVDTIHQSGEAAMKKFAVDLKGEVTQQTNPQAVESKAATNQAQKLTLDDYLKLQHGEDAPKVLAAMQQSLSEKSANQEPSLS